MPGIDSIQSINAEIARRCTAAGLPFDCGAGGLFNATVALVAEAPGERECALKQPLIGSSGRLLFDCLRKEGYTRNHVYITNVVKRKLVTAADNYRRPKQPITKNELEHWHALLRDELALLPNLRFVVALGDHALNALCGVDGITNWRGSVVDCTIRERPIRVLVTYNPAYPMHDPKYEVVFRMDLGKLKRVVNGTFKQPQFIEHINPTYPQAMDYLTQCRAVGAKGTPISADIETFGPSTETVCVGLAASNDEGMCISFRDRTDNTFGLHEERELRLALQRLLGDTRVRLIAQNSHFDASWMWYRDRIRWAPVWIDTMLAHHVLYPLLPHKLAFLTSQYTDHPYYKDDAKDWRGQDDIDRLWSYNVKDCCITRMVAFKLLDELREQGLERFYFDHVAKLAPELVSMTVLGVKCDTKLKGELNESIGRQVEDARARFTATSRIATGDPALDCNPLSTHDVSDLFFRQLRLVGRGSSVDEENRRRMLAHPKTTEQSRSVIVALDEYKKLHKFHSTYVESEADPDGRYRAAYRQTGVQSAPGRLSSAANAWGTGCVPGEAEVLTKQGWVRIDQVAHDTPIAQWADGFISFVVPRGYHVQTVEGNMLDYNGEQLRHSLTPGHRMVLKSSKGNIYMKHAAEARELVMGVLPVSGVYHDPLDGPCGDKRIHDPLHLQKLAMVQADANWDGTQWRIGLKKQRKKLRMRVLLAGTDVRESELSREGYTRFAFHDNTLSKFFGSYLLDYDFESLCAFIEEVGNWDAHRRGKSYIYSTTVYENAVWVQTIAHITGRSATLMIDEDNSNKYGNTSTKPLFLVNVKPRDYVYVESKNWAETVPAYDSVYCPQLADTPWLMRYRGSISVTFNSNMQNQPPEAHKMFVADEGYGFSYFDMSQIEARIVAWLANITRWKEQFELARANPGSYDAHCALAADMYKVPYEQVPKSDFAPDGSKTIRFIAKRCRHGLNYRMGIDRLATTAGLSLSEASAAYSVYHRTTPELQQWWDSVVADVRRDRCLYSPLGRRLIVLERLTDESLESIIAFIPQSTNGDHVAAVIYKAHSDPRWPKDAHVLINVHDALIALHRLQDGEVVRAVLKEYAEAPIVIRGEPLIVPAEFGMSYPDDQGVHRWSTIRKIKH